jgi:soluble lytic murein transglycosylase-like protein
MEKETAQMMEGIQEISSKYIGAGLRKMNTNELKTFVSLIYTESLFNWTNPTYKYFVRAIVAAESEFSPEKIGRYSNGVEVAYGLMQNTKDAFKEMNERVLFKYDNVNIMNVGDNTEVGLAYLRQCNSELKHRFKNKKITFKQIAWAYNTGIAGAIKYVASGEKRFLMEETKEYGEKVMFYYTNYCKGNFKVWYYEPCYTNK